VVEIGLIGRPGAEARMGPLAVIERQIAAEGSAGLGDAIVGLQIDPLRI
jgi:hypothetical protein